MPTPKTLAEMTTAVRQRSDQENSTFVSDAEIQDYIQQSAGELWDLLTEEAPSLFAAEDTFTTVAGQDGYVLTAEEADAALVAAAQITGKVYKLLDVAVVYNNRYYRLQRMSGDRRYPDHTTAGWSNLARVRWRFIYQIDFSIGEWQGLARNLTFSPAPDGAYTIGVRYIPQPPLISATEKFPSLSGWDEYIIVDAAIKVMQKEESDVSVLMAQKAALTDRLRHHVRSMASPGQTIPDLYSDYAGGADEFLPGWELA